jgi:stage II sporulation protein D
VRRVFTRCVVLVVAAACTSPRGTAAAPTPNLSAPAAATPSVGTPSVGTPSVGTPLFSGDRLSLKPPLDGSFLVQGAYPKSQSSCKHTHRGTVRARYPGALSVRSADDGTLSITVTLPFERYLEGIAEVPPSWPAAALEAQAVAARSYALAHIGWTGQQGESLQTPICSTSDCQVYGGIPVPPTLGIRRWETAVQRTQGQVLLYGDRPADTVYFSTSNGHTYGNDQVFGSSPLPYLRPVVERDDGASPTSHWGVTMPFPDLATFLRAGGLWPDGTRISSVRRTGSTVRVAGAGTSRSVDAGAFRDTVNAWASCLMPARYPTDGLPTTIPSDWYDVTSDPNGATVAGRGWGHGVGMVQWGAYGKAKRGWSADRILAYYYGGLTPTRYPEPGLIHVVVASGLRSLAVTPSGSAATINGATLGRETLHVSGDAGVVTVGT